MSRCPQSESRDARQWEPLRITNNTWWNLGFKHNVACSAAPGVIVPHLALHHLRLSMGAVWTRAHALTSSWHCPWPRLRRRHRIALTGAIVVSCSSRPHLNPIPIPILIPHPPPHSHWRTHPWHLKHALRRVKNSLSSCWLPPCLSFDNVRPNALTSGVTLDRSISRLFSIVVHDDLLMRLHDYTVFTLFTRPVCNFQPRARYRQTGT